MKTVKEYFDPNMITWLRENGLNYKIANIKSDKGDLNILYGDKFCLKIYDRLGHGFGATVNVTDKYDESIYHNDKFALTWAFKYFEIKETASFSDREENHYYQTLPNFIADIKRIIPLLNQMTPSGWSEMKEWINKEAKKLFP